MWSDVEKRKRSLSEKYLETGKFDKNKGVGEINFKDEKHKNGNLESEDEDGNALEIDDKPEGIFLKISSKLWSFGNWSTCKKSLKKIFWMSLDKV